MRIHYRRTPLVLAFIVAAVVAAGALSACAGGGGAPVEGLEGSPWQATEVGSPDSPKKPSLPVPAGVQVTLLLEDGKVSGSGGVNRYFGDYTATSEKLEFGVLGSTEMAGPPALMTLESAYLLALGRTTAYRLEGDTLELLDDAGNVTVRMVPAVELAVEGVDWVATGINNGKAAVQSPALGTTVTARFEGGTVTGNATINNYNGPYTVDGTKLTIGPLMSTKMGGPEEYMAQETAFLAAMSNVVSYRMDGDTLTLVAEDGAAQVVFVTAASLEPALPPDTPTSSPTP